MTELFTTKHKAMNTCALCGKSKDIKSFRSRSICAGCIDYVKQEI